MSLSSTTKKSLESYLSILGLTQTLPTRFDLFSRRKLLMFFAPNKEGLNCVKHLINIANTSKSPVLKLKTVICLHHIVMTNSCVDQTILDEPMSGLQKYAPCVENGNAEKWMCGLTHVYYNYIRKVCASSRVYWLIRNNRTFSNQESKQDLIIRVYIIINLIRSIFPARQFLLNFGRYFKAEYPIIIDINACIVEDMAVLYTGLMEIVNHLVNCYKTKLGKDETKQLLNIVDETYLIHENLYILFYNRYYTKDIDPPHINWMQLEPEQYKELKDTASEKKRKKMDSSIASIDSLDISQFEKTYFSHEEKTFKEMNFSMIQI